MTAGPGRPRGSLNRKTRESRAAIKALLEPHVEVAVAELVRIMSDGESDQVRLAACKEVLDRVYGKAAQPLDVDADINFVAEIPAPLDLTTWQKTFGRSGDPSQALK